ncbi:hypothetical protein P389DRAFT_93611 [Cystobasidium minutum MCA 4210]|uniref:uncharacterized protein n=1 Tax=Cystobasidium minutum MCA 4210 TaxID=1397322 RepID=UPI0034CDE2ED|eukprot:jgi/Rhomi1/93611/CE93610_768
MQATAASRKDDKRRHAAMNEPVDLASPDCELMAMRQFTCTYVPYISIDCKPLQRLFMVCAGRSFEVTQYAKQDRLTGDLVLPSNIKSEAGKLWHDLQPMS